MEQQIGVLWDFDGTLYGFKYIPASLFNAVMAEADRVAITTLLPQLDDERYDSEVRRAINHSHQRYGNAYEGFYPVAIQAGIEASDFHQKAFRIHYATMHKLIMKHYPKVLDHTRGWANGFQAIRGGVKHGLLTHAAIDEWCAPVMENIGILPFFDQGALVGRDQFNFLHKAISSEPLKIGIQRMGMPPDKIWFAEDDLHNLERAAEVRGVKKVYIHHGRPLSRLPSFVDFQFADPSEFMLYLQTHVIKPPAPGSEPAQTAQPR